MTNRYLCHDSEVNNQEPTGNYEEEARDIETEAQARDTYKVQFTEGLDTSDYTVLTSRFNLQAYLDAEKTGKKPLLHKSKKAARERKTAQLRKEVSKAKKAESLEQLSDIVSRLNRSRLVLTLDFSL